MPRVSTESIWASVYGAAYVATRLEPSTAETADISARCRANEAVKQYRKQIVHVET